ncbi:glycosyltransferase family 2 protein [Candidatus Parcubacteria bacterium]|nr:MAG: glycosyltransferase family 2 protein [Candidatus Parcubacteria bacterium]
MVDATITYILLFISLYFEVFLLVTFLQRRFQTRALPQQLTVFPKVAIVVPCYNEEKGIEATMRSLIALDYPREKLEIIVVDDGSKDATLAIAQQFAHEAHVRIFHKENGGKHTAMNYALARTDAELIGCLDADSEVDSQALRAIAPVFNDMRIAAITPGIHVRTPQNLLQHMQHVEYRLSIFNRFVHAALGSTYVTPGPFSIFRTRVVRELGGWRHGHSTEDMEMAMRVQVAGHLIANVPGAIVYTGTPRKLRSLFRQRVRWTYGHLRNAMDYRHMFGNRTYGNLSIIVLPLSLLSIGTGLFFFWRVLYYAATTGIDMVQRTEATGIYPYVSLSSFQPFYIETSAMWMLIYMSIALIVALICAGTIIGTNQKLPPRATPLFLFFYSFLVPLWLGTAVVRAVFKTGVRWR